MGAGRWTTETYRSYAASTDYVTASRERVFSNRHLPADLDPSKIILRESCDSEDSPNSVPIIMGLDVTGSMGLYAELIAKEHLPKLMTDIIEQSPVTDPHLMFMGIGDVRSDNAPLQVSQFEADIRILESLRSLYLEGGGGGNGTESYDLPWYFAANRTNIDSFIKRGQKGFLFTFGDEKAPDLPLGQVHLSNVFGTADIPMYHSTAELLAEVKKTYNVFHIIIEQGSYCGSHYRLQEVRGSWSELMGNNAIFLRNVDDLSEVVIATIRIACGEDMNEVIRTAKNPEALRYAFSNSLN